MPKGLKASCTRLFNQIIAESKKFPQINYQDYFGRLALEQKVSIKNINNEPDLRQIRDKAKSDLEQMKRMVSVNQLYVKNPSILEAEPAKPKQRSSQKQANK